MLMAPLSAPLAGGRIAPTAPIAPPAGRYPLSGYSSRTLDANSRSCNAVPELAPNVHHRWRASSALQPGHGSSLTAGDAGGFQAAHLLRGPRLSRRRGTPLALASCCTRASQKRSLLHFAARAPCALAVLASHASAAAAGATAAAATAAGAAAVRPTLGTPSRPGSAFAAGGCGVLPRVRVGAAATVAGAAVASRAEVQPETLRIADGLPIRECLEDVLVGLDRSSGLVLQAPPGAGKTTVVPLAMLAHAPEYLRDAQRILVLEPRRVAAKGAARRMAASLGEPVGGTVGYRVRLDSQVSARTRIEVVTEGILLRRLQHDPELAGVGAVVFDEFHERNLDADTALALCLDVQRLARPDLRLVVMSATLGGGLGDRVRALLAEAAAEEAGGGGGAIDGGAAAAPGGGSSVPLVLSEGRSFPVQTFYLGRPDATERGSLERGVADAVARALREAGGGVGVGDAGDGGGGGDVLVFLPGVGEIHKVARLLEEEGTARKYGVRVLPLHGNLAPEEQDEVLRPAGRPAGAAPRRRRRVILSTPIAESSVTIDGVTAVVDSGLRRAPRYDPASAINRLDTIRISEASAEQRRGRAGRTAPGRCYRLWAEREPLPAVSEPEIATADLAPTALELALWGSPDGRGLLWLDPPPEELLAAGRELLQDLGAVEPGSGRATPHGRLLARLGLHPRWGQSVLRGAALGAAELAAVVANMLGSERDVLRGGGGGQRSADIMLRLQALARDEAGVDRGAARRILQGARSMAAMAAATVAAEQRRRAAAAGGGGAAAANEDADDEAVVAALRAAGAKPLESADASEDEAAEDDGGAAGDSAAGGGAAARAGASVGGCGPADFERAWREQLGREGLVGALVAAAYPDRIAERRDRSNKRAAFTLSTGQVVVLPSEEDPLRGCEYLAVADIGGAGPAAAWRRDGGGASDTVRAAAGLSSGDIERYLKDMVQERDVVFWASASKAVLARRQRRLGCLVLAERAVPVSDAAALPALLQGFKEMGGVRGMGLSRELEAWRQRVVWLRDVAAAGSPDSGSGSAPSRLAALPDLSDAGLLGSARTWLPPHLAGVRSRSDMLKLDWAAILRSLVPWELQQQVDSEAPSHLTLPTGTRALVDYGREPPTVSARMQEVFGLAETPRLAGGRIPLQLELLNPAGRPAAVTSDLASFWRSVYPEVRKELRGRYPKHLWPEDPLQAEATRLTKKALAAQMEAKQQAEPAAGAAPAGAGGKAGKAGKGSGNGGGGGKRR